MPTHGWFPTPVYVDQIEGDEYKQVQQELFSAYEKLEFGQNPNWSSDTHELNKNAFAEDHLTNLGCTKFLAVLDKHLNLYLDQIGCTFSRKYHIRQSWFTKTKPGKYAHRHDHGSDDISGVYYLETNEKDGNLLLQTPHQPLQSNWVYACINKDVAFPLGKGIIGLWPSNIVHGTETNKTDDDRISISFNIIYER